MLYIAIAAAFGVLLLQASDAIPAASVGGPMAIALVVFAGAVAVAIEEAWRRKRSAPGWIFNIALALLAAFFAAPVAGFVMVVALRPFMDGSRSLAAEGGAVFSVALAGVTIVTLLGCRSALWLAARWR